MSENPDGFRSSRRCAPLLTFRKGSDYLNDYAMQRLGGDLKAQSRGRGEPGRQCDEGIS
jgi:hypothetical protein